MQLAGVASLASEVLQLGGTAVLCRVLPKVKPPCTYSLLSIRAQIAALKMSMVLQASEMLADASIVPAFIRMCGATFGHGCAMGLQAASLDCRRSPQEGLARSLCVPAR